MSSDALGRNAGQQAAFLVDCCGGFGCNVEIEYTCKAHGAENAQTVLLEARRGISDAADDAGGEVIRAVIGVNKPLRGMIRHRIHGKIAAREIIGEPVRERDRIGSAVVSVRAVDAVGRNLNGHFVDDRCDSAVLHTGLNDMEAAEALLDLFRARRGGAVPVMRLRSAHRIPDAPADDICRIAGVGEGIEGALHGCRRRDVHLFVHKWSPL